MIEPKKRGGRREGAGRPLKGDAEQKRRNIMLSDALAEKARRLGAGNLSEGIRLALERCKEEH